MNPDIYQAILAGKTFAALSPRALWRLSGHDAVRYLNGQVTNDVALLAEGHGCRAAVCTAKGRMEGDVFIARHEDQFYLDADITLRESLGARLEKYLIADDAAWEDLTDSWSFYHLLGNVPAINPGLSIPHPRYGLPGHDIWRPQSRLMPEFPIVETDILETLRLEAGIPLWGKELDLHTLPPEAGPWLTEAINYRKGCYVGQETIARLKSIGHVNRTLVFLQSESETVPPAGARLQHDNREAGKITSSGYSPLLQRGMALGYVNYQLAQPGQHLTADAQTLTIAQAPRGI